MKLKSIGLEVYRFCNKDDYGGIGGVCIEPDGSMIATNGHVLSMFKPDEKPETEGKRVKITKESARDLRKFSKKSNEFTANTAEANGMVNFKADSMTWGAENKGEQFPDYNVVIPKETNDGSTVSILLNADYLRDIIAATKAMGGSAILVTIQTAVEPENSPVTFTSTLDGGTVKTVLMPLMQK